MIRKVITIDEEKCDGCGECVPACEEGAIAIVDGKARLVSEVYCDGLGACLGNCPQGAITMEEREAPDFDEAAVKVHLSRQAAPATGGCPGAAMRSVSGGNGNTPGSSGATRPSRLASWPVQLALVPPYAPYLAGADVLLVADCVPFAYADFHRDFLQDRPVLIACPKLDNVHPYVEKLAAIIRENNLASLTVMRMEVPCCSGITRLAMTAAEASGKDIPLREVVIGIEGGVLSG